MSGELDFVLGHAILSAGQVLSERTMRAFTVLSRGWHENLRELARGTEDELFVVSPYVTHEGADAVTGSLTARFKSTGTLRLLADLSPMNVCQGSTDVRALADLARATANAELSHLPRVHAKVYVSVQCRAIVTSGNLTGGGLFRNYEYGVEIHDREIVQRIHTDISDYARLGTRVGVQDLAVYGKLVEELKAEFDLGRKAAHAAASEFTRALRRSEDELLRLRVRAGPVTSVFARTIEYLLQRHGPTDTRSLHPLIQEVHPDLCDDAVDRVIDGVHFGKRWKHWVRTSQQRLKSEGRIELRDGLWHLVADRSSGQ